jgi:hypothetical protein
MPLGSSDADTVLADAARRRGARPRHWRRDARRRRRDHPDAGHDGRGHDPRRQGLEAFPEARLLAVRRPQLPDARLVGRAARPHVLFRRRSGRRHPRRSGRGAAPRARRRDHVQHRAASEAVAAARLAGDRGPLRRDGRDQRGDRGQPEADDRPDRAPLEPADECRRRGRDEGGDGADHAAGRGQAAEGGHRPAAVVRHLAQAHGRSSRSTTSPAASPRSSPTSGPRTTAAATTCTAT